MTSRIKAGSEARKALFCRHFMELPANLDMASIAFGAFKTARQSAFMPDQRFDIFDTPMFEETRHIGRRREASAVQH